MLAKSSDGRYSRQLNLDGSLSDWRSKFDAPLASVYNSEKKPNHQNAARSSLALQEDDMGVCFSSFLKPSKSFL